MNTNDRLSRFERFQQEIIYFIESKADNTIKIGYTTNLEARLATLQTAHAHRLNVLHSMPGSKALEAQLHQRFAHLRVRSDSWMGEHFRAEPELYGYIMQLKERRGEPFVLISESPWEVAWQSLLCLIGPKLYLQVVWLTSQTPFAVPGLIAVVLIALILSYWGLTKTKPSLACCIRLACLTCGFVLALWRPI